jgi:hypothetical protein
MMARLLLGLSIVAVLAVGCTSHTEPREASPSADAASTSNSGQLTNYRDSNLVLKVPATWRAEHFDEVSSFTASLVDLSNQRMHKPCTTRHVNDGIETRCGWPLRALRPGGVLVRWEQDGFPVPRTWRFSDQPGRPMRVDGRAARRTVGRPGDCAQVGATEMVRTDIKRPIAGNYYRVTACLRGPGLPELEEQVEAMLASAELLHR